MKRLELLAPAGDFEKLKTALYFGADAVYVGGKSLTLRAFAGNFDDAEMERAVKYTHERGKKLYVAVNILARNADLGEAADYFAFLQSVGADGVIVSDIGLMNVLKRVAPRLPLHVSTQTSALNAETVKFYADFGARRVVLARELSLKEIAEIHAAVPQTEIEAFAHGAMCIAYSGRCLLSSYLSGRDSNRGECVQPCRWSYELREKNTAGEYLPIEEDGRGTYILNSKDLNMLDHLGEMAQSGVVSFKVEGRMKSSYYIATVINAYRRALDAYAAEGERYKENPLYQSELKKTAHRAFTSAYASGKNDDTVNAADSQSRGERTFAAAVLGYDGENRRALVEMRNRFKKGDVLEVLSPNETLNAKIAVKGLTDEAGNAVEDAKLVQQKLWLYTDIKLSAGDILRK
ncbi:MAG: peptidase U32 [Bacillota bacterium]|nr:MAG: peptidase U32 [Bacillota bacterium]